MLRKRIFNGLIFILLAIVIGIVANGSCTKANINVYNIAEITEQYVESETFLNNNYEYNGVLNATYTSATYKAYTKGMTTVNVMFNFVNYASDTTNHFTQNEINNIMTTFRSDVGSYFERMSQGFVTINIDYVCCTAPNSYDYYRGLDDANYSLESNLLSEAVSARKDYSGATKNFIFDNYNFRVNAFAGNSGAWSTFLWPHAFMGSGLILMMEYKQGMSMSSATMCHEMMHTFGVGDLYAYTGNSQNFGAQGLDIMGSSTKNMATNAYFRNKVGWIKSSEYGDDITTPIEEITESTNSYTLKLKPNCTEKYGETIAYKFGENEKNGEYFIIEFRVKGYAGVYDSSISKTGVVIYRINPKYSGNEDGNNTNGGVELMFMGNTSIDITSYSYPASCLLTAGSTYGNLGETTNTSLVYSSGVGKSNLFNGENSEIIVSVISINENEAQISITFKPVRTAIDMSAVCWSYTNPFEYSNTTYEVQLINIPTSVTVTYSNTFHAKNAGTYTVVATFVYDNTLYFLENLNISKTLQWKILPANIEIKIDNKESKYGYPLQKLTYTITSGTVYGSDSLGVTLTKALGNGVGTYNISGKCSNTNYLVNFSSGTYTITQRSVHIKVSNQSYSLHTFISINQNSYEILAGGDGVVAGDTLNVTIFAEDLNMANVTAGTYTLNAKTTNSNYNLNVTKGTLTIDNIVDLSAVKWNYENKFGYTATTHKVQLLNVPKVISVNYLGIASSKNAGVYTAQAVLQYDSNIYQIVNNNFSKNLIWEILPEQIHLQIDNKTSKYGTDLKELTYKITGGTIFGGDNLDIKLQKSGGNNAGVYSISATCGNKNYQIVAESAEYVITQRVITIKLIDQTFKQNRFRNINQTYYEILDGDQVLDGDNLSVVISANLGQELEIGEYVLSAVCKNTNYRLNVINGTLSITEPDTPFSIASTITIALLILTIINVIIFFAVRRYKSYHWKRTIEY